MMCLCVLLIDFSVMLVQLTLAYKGSLLTCLLSLLKTILQLMFLHVSLHRGGGVILSFSIIRGNSVQGGFCLDSPCVELCRMFVLITDGDIDWHLSVK